MNRPKIAADRVSSLADGVVSKFHRAVVDEVIEAVAKEPWVIVGMAQNPAVKRARKQLEAAGIPFRYIEHGSYLSKWKPRLAIKLWAGFPTFPMVFHDGALIGGSSELKVWLAENAEKRGDQPSAASLRSASSQTST